MKTIILTFSLFFITSCDKNDGTSQETNDLVGSWHLTIYGQGFGPTYYFDEGDVLYIFNSNNTIDATFNITLPSSYVSLPIEENGNYPYSIISSDSTSINSHVIRYRIDNDTLRFIPHNTDGAWRIFKKVEN